MGKKPLAGKKEGDEGERVYGLLSRHNSQKKKPPEVESAYLTNSGRSEGI